MEYKKDIESELISIVESDKEFVEILEFVKHIVGIKILISPVIALITKFQKLIKKLVN